MPDPTNPTVDRYLNAIIMPARLAQSRRCRDVLRRAVQSLVDLKTVYLDELARNVRIPEEVASEFFVGCRIRGLNAHAFQIVMPSSGNIPTTLYFTQEMFAYIAAHSPLPRRISSRPPQPNGGTHGKA